MLRHFVMAIFGVTWVGIKIVHFVHSYTSLALSELNISGLVLRVLEHLV